MTAELHRLTAAGPVLGPDPGIIELVSNLLERAKRGELKGLGVFFVSGNDDTFTIWVPGCASRSDMVAASSRLHWKIMMADRGMPT